MITDRQDNGCTGATAAAMEHYDRAIEQFNIYRGDPPAELDHATAAAPEFVMAYLAKAHLMVFAAEPAATAEARRLVDHARTLPADAREASHLAALDHVLRGDWNAAALALDLHSMSWPRDMLALQSGHSMDFYRGNARDLRDRIARALPHWSSEVPGQSFVLGMYAFGLEETGDYDRAEDVGREAIDREPLDCWAHHAVAHVMEMQGRAQDGIGWMTTREPSWSGDDNFLKIHNWWHLALFHLDLGNGAEVLSLYDGPIRGQRSGVAIDLVDASALLWRLHLAGIDVGDRWGEVSLAWEQHADGRTYPFNDWHAMMAHLGAGRDDAVARLNAALAETAAGDTPMADWARTVGVPLVEGFAAFWRGDYEASAMRLHGARYVANRIGGSHAQRDIIDWTLTEAALRGGLADLAESLAHERLSLKPHSPINRAFLARAGTRAPAH